MTEHATAAAPPRPATDPARGRLRVVFLLRVAAEAQQRFLDAYQRIRHQVAGTEGHLADQLCQSTTDPAEWMIVSEWESPEHFYAWERRDGHRELAGPMIACTTERRSLRYLVRHQTLGKARQLGGAR
jgi:heme-degrading monooxygenase HmoA